jgi:hypothetical protein
MLHKLHSLHKLHPVGIGSKKEDKTSSSDIFVTKVEGPSIICKGAYYQFKVSKFNRNDFLLGEIVSKIQWGYSIENVDKIIKINTHSKGVNGKMEILMKWKIPKNVNAEFLKVYAWLVKPTENVSFSSSILNYPFLFDKYKEKGLNQSANRIADDLCYGDGINETNYFVYTKEEIENLGVVMKNVTMKSSVKFLWVDMRLMINTLFTSESYKGLKNVANQMIDRFEKNTGGIFSNELLTEKVKNHKSTLEFLNKIDKQIKLKLKANLFDPVYLNNERRHYLSERFGRPQFQTNTDTFFSGLTIMINDTWAYEVYVSDFESINENNHQIKLKIILYDHFGLDLPDVQNNLYYTFAGFRAWFVLQHLHSYRPFITKIEFERTIKI